jgi:methylmalonyl-CoA/ethylmalonyl-CoA epimerase
MPRVVKQIAVVVKDVEQAMKHYWTVLGIGPWDVRHFRNDRVRAFEVHGQPVTEAFEFICAVAWHGDLEYELIQPVKGPNIYWQFLEEKGEGLHHYKEIVAAARIPEVLADFKAKGIEVLQTGWIDNDVHYYLDTEALLGFVYEIGNGGEIGAPDRRFPAD